MQQKPLLFAHVLSLGFCADSQLRNTDTYLLQVPSKAGACFSEQAYETSSALVASNSDAHKRVQIVITTFFMNQQSNFQNSVSHFPKRQQTQAEKIAGS